MSVPPPGAWPAPQPAGRAPVDQPRYDATIGEAAARFWRKFAVFSGRASRSEYWWWALISFVISVVLQVVGSLIFGGGLFLNRSSLALGLREVLLPLVPSMVWSVVVLIPTIALSVRRLHDTNRSGWWYLLTVPSFVGLPFYFIGLASFDPQRISVGDFSTLAVEPLAAGFALLLVGGIGGIILLVFYLEGPNPRGARFDRRT